VFTRYAADCAGQRGSTPGRGGWTDAQLAPVAFALFDNTATPNRQAPVNLDGFGQGGFPASAEVFGGAWPSRGLPADDLLTCESSPAGGFALFAAAVKIGRASCRERV
jgi:hypothetical protein